MSSAVHRPAGCSSSGLTRKTHRWAFVSVAATLAAALAAVAEVPGDGTFDPIGVLRITRDQVPVPIADARRRHVPGDQLPLIQKNDRFFIVAVPSETDFPEIEALPAYGAAAQSVVVSEGGMLHVLQGVGTTTGYILLQMDESFPLLRSDEAHFEALIERLGHRARLRIPRGKSEGALQQLPASAWTNAAGPNGAGHSARTLFSMDDVVGIMEARGETYYLFRDRQTSESWFQRLASRSTEPPPREAAAGSEPPGESSRLKAAWAAVRRRAIDAWKALSDASPNRPIYTLLIPWAVILAGVIALRALRSRRQRRQMAARSAAAAAADRAPVERRHRPSIRPPAARSEVPPPRPPAPGSLAAAAAAASTAASTASANGTPRLTLRLPGTEPIVAAAAAKGDLSGNLPSVSLSWLFQMLHGQSATGTVDVFDEAERPAGTVYLREGHVLDARQRGVRGADAFYGILAVDAGRFVFQRDRLPLRVHTTIQDDLMHLLIEAQRRIDESRATGAGRG
jgi:hypothetical protein